MDNSFWNSIVDSSWFFGLVVVSGAAGAVGTLIFFSVFWVLKVLVVCMGHKSGEDESDEDKNDTFVEFLFTGVLMGVVERFFFTFAIWALSGNGAFQAAITWVAIKGQVHFKIFTENSRGVPRAYLGLLGSLVSMTFAILGGYFWAKGVTLSDFTSCYHDVFSCLNTLKLSSGMAR